MRSSRLFSIPHQHLCVWSWIQSCHKAPYESSHFKPWTSVWHISFRQSTVFIFSSTDRRKERLIGQYPITSPRETKQSWWYTIEKKREKKGNAPRAPRNERTPHTPKTINPAIEWSPGLCGPRGARTHDPNIKSVVLPKPQKASPFDATNWAREPLRWRLFKLFSRLSPLCNTLCTTRITLKLSAD